MKTPAKLVLALAVLLAFVAVSASAAEETLSGNIVCAKCTLKKADAKACQNVLVVENGETTTEYYIENNAAGEKVGMVCTGKKAVTVTGTVSEKDGRKWIAASSIEEKKS